MAGKQEKRFFLLTNLPGSGKSTVGLGIANAVEQKGLTSYTINEFSLFGEWIDANPKYVSWRDTPEGRIVDLKPQHYQSAFDHVAVRMTEEFLAHYKDADVIISEAARDVEGVGYLPLFQHLVDTLGDMTKFINLNVYVNNKEEVRRRVRERAKRNPLAASVAVVDLYLKDAHNYPHSTSTQAAAQFSEHFIYNGEIDNSKKPEQVVQTINGIVAQIFASQSQ